MPNAQNIKVRYFNIGKPWYRSKKVLALIAGLVGAAALSAGVAIPPVAFHLIIAYLAGQGLADLGKEKGRDKD